MRKGVVLALSLSVLLLDGCDMFRRLAGRPVSGEIARRKAEIVRRQTERDSVELALRQAADTLALLDSVRNVGGIRFLSDMGGFQGTGFDAAYCVIVGSFRKQANADAMVRTVSSAGYVPVVLSFRNGLTAVGVSPSYGIEEALHSMDRVRMEDFCPPDAWLLANR